MAGEVFHQKMLIKEKPVVPGFNSEDLAPTPELPKAKPNQQIEKDSYILNSPKSGVAMSPLVPPAHFIKEALKGQPTAPGTVYKGPDPFQQNNKIRPSDSDDQFMDVMRSGFV